MSAGRPSGLLALIEDLGRPGYQRFGVPESGAMDRNSLMLANALVNNPLGAAAIEALLLPPVLRC